MKPEDRLPRFLAIIDKIEDKFDVSAREWVDIIVYIYVKHALRKRGSDSKTLHHLDVTLRIMQEIGKTRGIFVSEGQANTPTK
jgi:hypothetical protein